MAARRKKQVLAQPEDPLITSDGEVFEPDACPSSGEIAVIEAKSTLNAKEFEASIRRGLSELPAPVQTQSGINAIVVYSILGLGNREIAEALNIDAATVIELKQLSAYSETFEMILGELINANATLLQGRIAAHTQVAFGQVVNLATRGKKEEVRLRASTDILDRAGVRPQDNVMRTKNDANELRIVITKQEDVKDVGVTVNDIEL